MNHDRICTCVPGFTGDPRHSCEHISPPPECTSDSQCPQEHICQNQRCVGMFELPDFVDKCLKLVSLDGCRSSSYCPTDKTCVKGKCVGPCQLSGSCGANAFCTASDHVAMCSCPPGYRGDPTIECKGKPMVLRSPLLICENTRNSTRVSIGRRVWRGEDLSQTKMHR